MIYCLRVMPFEKMIWKEDKLPQEDALQKDDTNRLKGMPFRKMIKIALGVKHVALKRRDLMCPSNMHLLDRFTLRGRLVTLPMGDPFAMPVTMGKIWVEVPHSEAIEALLGGDLQVRWNRKNGHRRDDTPILAMMRGDLVLALELALRSATTQLYVPRLA
ncbi:hypothetical protein RHMOL_Rhmol13G0172100 [Rhododendron molle]|uniref:Uncharacterized protein n=1 Tax=Rhododendron molle TaxID=49168 RepID=A0ACC0L849_RHOML|nr:hypothetical protein RHMOL_Rhmol13G0172100 [Rhododendron molle]